MALDVISKTGLTEIIAEATKPYFQSFARNPWVFLLMVIMGFQLIRLVLPSAPASLVSILCFLPMASSLRIHPFVIGLVVVACNFPWFLPQQDIVFQNLHQGTEGKLFDHRQTVKLAFVDVLIIIAAVSISIPYWRHFGLIP